MPYTFMRQEVYHEISKYIATLCENIPFYSIGHELGLTQIKNPKMTDKDHTTHTYVMAHCKGEKEKLQHIAMQYTIGRKEESMLNLLEYLHGCLLNLASVFMALVNSKDGIVATIFFNLVVQNQWNGTP